MVEEPGNEVGWEKEWREERERKTQNERGREEGGGGMGRESKQADQDRTQRSSQWDDIFSWRFFWGKIIENQQWQKNLLGWIQADTHCS